MRCALLYSGGKDSTLAALLLDPFYDVTLVSGSFGICDTDPARESASAAGFDHVTVELDLDVAHDAAERIHDDGYPRNGIQQVHEHAVETVASGDWLTDADGIDTVAAVADGTRRDDRVPTVDRPLAQSVEDRFDVDYLAPLAGIGRGAIDAMAADKLIVESGPSAEVPKADYEVELRALLRERYGEGAVADVFPEHTQSRVKGLR
ncbi:alpha hydrolase [Haloarcula taiwanensis]|uniref:Alpha hydrolase n=1 Tax=Haloarcula taiwanensis TaxID=1932004 RepID=A0A2H4ZV57_9EURY|nr:MULTISPECIES: alpha hydrolase [Haloarcula]AUG46359.1 alpha hydrolase [Haloarcula taiwanensis]RLM36578.1 alpha hydrolase [Haloarcula sp. Atlit-120R]RLM45038.1 alpha hydrolase [Haloarcula sp. Atlit-47R]